MPCLCARPRATAKVERADAAMADADKQYERIPVYVLTGFLGSGKTTLLSRMVRAPEASDTAVIVNEFGEVGLDHILLTRGDENDVVLLDSGCLCCALNSSLEETLTDLFHRRNRDEIPAFSRVVIETTGLADPAPILHTLMTDRLLASRYRLGGVLTVVDVLNIGSQLAHYGEITRQIAFADRVILTKADVAGPETLSQAESSATGLNPRAEILVAVQGDLAPDRLLAAVPDLPPRAGIRGPDHDHHAHHTDNITSQFFPLPQTLGWETYSAFVQHLQRNTGDRILRIKGLVRFEGETQPRAIQAVQHVFAPPEPISGTATAALGLVVIGRDLEQDELEQAFRYLTGDAEVPA